MDTGGADFFGQNVAMDDSAQTGGKRPEEQGGFKYLQISYTRIVFPVPSAGVLTVSPLSEIECLSAPGKQDGRVELRCATWPVSDR